MKELFDCLNSVLQRNPNYNILLLVLNTVYIIFPPTSHNQLPQPLHYQNNPSTCRPFLLPSYKFLSRTGAKAVITYSVSAGTPDLAGKGLDKNTDINNMYSPLLSCSFPRAFSIGLSFGETRYENDLFVLKGNKDNSIAD